MIPPGVAGGLPGRHFAVNWQFDIDHQPVGFERTRRCDITSRCCGPARVASVYAILLLGPVTRVALPATERRPLCTPRRLPNTAMAFPDIESSPISAATRTFERGMGEVTWSAGYACSDRVPDPDSAAHVATLGGHANGRWSVAHATFRSESAGVPHGCCRYSDTVSGHASTFRGALACCQSLYNATAVRRPVRSISTVLCHPLQLSGGRGGGRPATDRCGLSACLVPTEPHGGRHITSRCCGPARVASVCCPTPRPAPRVALPATERRPLCNIQSGWTNGLPWPARATAE